MTNYEIGHDNWELTLGGLSIKDACPRCHRNKPLGTCEDGCKMCQSCYHKVHGLSELPSDTMFQGKIQG